MNPFLELQSRSIMHAKERNRSGGLVGRFWAKVERESLDGCWIWTGCILNHRGYGQFRAGERRLVAHRFAYELLIGPIPEGMELDHVRARGCIHRACVNPAHLEPVTCLENIRRARRTRCANGHYIPRLIGQHGCAICTEPFPSASKVAA